MIQAKIGVIMRSAADGKQYGCEVMFDTVPSREEVIQAAVLLAEESYNAYAKELEEGKNDGT